MSGRGRRGFTLLEVMVALAILASSMLALSQVVSGALRNHVRASHLDVATLLARGKLAELEDEYERKGFRDFDQSDEGTFEADGHAEVRWKAEVLKPKVDLGPDRILALLTGGDGDLAKLLGGSGAGKPGEPTTVQTGAAGVAASMRQQLTVIGEQIKKGVRELRLTVSWPDGKHDESFTVVEHLVVLTPREVAP